MSVSNEIEYNNDKYAILIKLIRTALAPSLEEVEEEDTVNLPLDNLQKMELTTDITDPLLRGVIEFTDGQESYLNGFTGSACNYAFIGVKKFDPETQGNKTGVPTFEWSFEHLFLIDDISIIGMKEDSVSYRINLTSSFFWNFMNSNPVSTYANGEESINELLKILLVENGLPVGDKISEMDIEDKMNFITQAGSKMSDSYKYLIEKMNSNESIGTNGLSLITYNHLDNLYDIWNSKMTQEGEISETPYTDSIRININQNFMDTVFEQNPKKLLLSNYVPQTDIIRNLSDIKQVKYDYEKNSFEESDLLVDVMYEDALATEKIDYQSKFKPYDQFIAETIETQYRNYTKVSTRWNNPTYAIRYKTLMSILTSNNALIINTGGKFDRFVGDAVYVGVDVNKDAISSLQYLIGWYTTLRVRHIFTPTSYTSNVVVGRFTELKDVDLIRDVI